MKLTWKSGPGFCRYEEDIKNTKQLGCNCFRFSFEWARLEPSKGNIDQSAIER